MVKNKGKNARCSEIRNRVLLIVNRSSMSCPGAVGRITLHAKGSDHRKYHMISVEERRASYLRNLKVAMENWILILSLSSLC